MFITTNLFNKISGSLLSMFALAAFTLTGNYANGQTDTSCTVDLIAGQNYLAGSVDIVRNGDSVTVYYSTTGNWYMTQTHLYVGDCGAIPMTRGNNPKVGHFPYGDETLNNATSASYTIYMPDSCFCVAAHAVVSNGTQTETAWGDGIDMGGKQWATYFTCCEPTTRINPCTGLTIQCSPDTVIGYVMGTKSNGVSPVDPSRIDPWRATGTPENDDTTGTINFHTLGYGGTLTLGFTQGVIEDVPNAPDFWVVETSYGDPDCPSYPEKVNVEVSNDGVTWYLVATNVCQNGMVDIAAANDPDLCAISYVRLTDVTSPFGNTDGYDVDGIICINQPGGGFKVAPVHPASGQYIDDLTFIVHESNGIQIESTSLSGGSIYAEITDISGRVVAKFEDQPQMSHFFATDQINPGIYFVRILVDGNMVTEKILVQ